MPEPAEEDFLDEAVRAVGHPGRRTLLCLARDGEQTADALAQVKALLDALWSARLGALAVQAEADEQADHPIGAATEDTAWTCSIARRLSSGPGDHRPAWAAGRRNWTAAHVEQERVAGQKRRFDVK